MVAFQTHGATYNCEEAEERHYIPIYQTKTSISGSDGNIWLYYHSSKSLCNDNGYDAIIYGCYPSATSSIWFGSTKLVPWWALPAIYIIGTYSYIIGAPCYIIGAAAHYMLIRDAIFPSSPFRTSTWGGKSLLPTPEHESISLDR